MHKLVDVDCWYHVVSKLNTTDILSRDLRFSELTNNDLWFKGPSTISLDDVPYNRFSLKNLLFKNDAVLMDTSKVIQLSTPFKILENPCLSPPLKCTLIQKRMTSFFKETKKKKILFPTSNKNIFEC